MNVDSMISKCIDGMNISGVSKETSLKLQDDTDQLV